MRVEVHCFALVRELVGSRCCELELPAGATVELLKARLAADHPRLAAILPAVRVAIDNQYAADGDLVPEGAEVALIPPVSGG